VSGISETGPPERYRPLALIGVILGALLLFSIFVLGFLVAPLAVLLLFYVGYAASDRNRRMNSGASPPSAPDEEP
jgi:hypothetical protein